jgi:sulfite oxidase
MQHTTNTFARRRFLQAVAATTAGLSLPMQLWSRELLREGDQKQLLVRSESPFNAEPDPTALVKEWITPLSYFYVRNHGDTPELDSKGYQLSIEGLVGKPRTFSYAELRELLGRQPEKSRVLEATLTCAGNRREEMSATKKISGVQWSLGAIGNATWSGVPLRTLLEACELKPEAKHIWFEGADPIEHKGGLKEPFGGSIPLADGIEQRSGLPGAIVALEMNGRPLAAKHGFPARMVVPGFIGARSVKWLKRIIVSDKPSTNHFLAHAYKLVQSDSVEEAESKNPIYEFAINSALCAPAADKKVPAGKIRLAGYALPPGDGSAIKRVEVSLDGGKNWKSAKLEGKEAPFCWRLWSLEADLRSGKHAVVVRAIDSKDRMQPEMTPWNAKGYMQNAWHRRELETA